MKFQDRLTCKTDCNLSFRERLRMLWTGKVRVTTTTFTENIIGAHTTITSAIIGAPAESEAKAFASLTADALSDWGSPITP